MFERIRTPFSHFVTVLQNHPVAGFFILVGLLFGVIILGNTLRAPETVSDETTALPRPTKFFDTAQQSAFVTVPGKIKKESVVHIVALAPGVISNISVSPGQSVRSGQTLLTLTNDYGGGRAEIEKRLAAESFRLTEELADIDKEINRLEERKTKRDSTLSGTEEDIELARLEREKALRKSTLEQGALSLQMSNLSDAVLRPKTFASGTVQSIRVKRGDFVTPGQTIATIATPKGATTIEAFLDGKTARLFYPAGEATLTVGNEALKLQPTFFSKIENENGLFSVLFTLSESIRDTIVNGEFIKITLPLKSQDPAVTLVPIDAIFQDDSRASVLVERDGQAVALDIILGNIYGSFVEVQSGLENSERIILNRAVIAGDRVSSES